MVQVSAVSSGCCWDTRAAHGGGTPAGPARLCALPVGALRAWNCNTGAKLALAAQVDRARHLSKYHTCSLCRFADACEVMLLSFLGASVRCEWGVPASSESTLTSVVFAGMLLGVYTLGALADGIGRRRGFLASAALLGASGLASALAPSFAVGDTCSRLVRVPCCAMSWLAGKGTLAQEVSWHPPVAACGTCHPPSLPTHWFTCPPAHPVALQWLLAIRMVVGMALGGTPIAVTIFAEYLPSAERGRWMLLMQSFWTLGGSAGGGTMQSDWHQGSSVGPVGVAMCTATVPRRAARAQWEWHHAQ